ncbi:MAG: hypothetical protein ACR2FG_11640 [Marmoricola sp.]
MGLDAKARPQFVLSLLSWATVLVLYFVTKWRGGRLPSAARPADAVASFDPDQLVISTLRVDHSTWLWYDVVDRARSTYDMPVTHVIATAPATAADAIS